MDLYRRAFLEHGHRVAQILLTHADLRSRERHLNARNTVTRLLEAGITPIVNENDTVAVDEIRFGDNDLLASLVGALIGAEMLVILGTVDGLLSKPPGHDGTVVRTVTEIDESIRSMVGGGTAFGRGGMGSKLDAADMIARCGGTTVFASARERDVLPRVCAGEAIGTTFLPRGEGMPGRKRWIAFFDRPQGQLHLDHGATRAITDQGRSLLAVGVRSTDGRFERGAPVRLLDPTGREIARGLVNYPADDLRRIQGQPSEAIPGLLGRREYDEVVHRDNLVMI